MQEVVVKIIRQELEKMGIKVIKIVLFGSRSKENFKEFSDWDLLIVVAQEVSREEKIEISHLLRRRFAELHIPCDVLVRSEKEVEERKNVIGSVIRTAMKEGIVL